MWSVICFLDARNMKPADIHCQLCEAYGEHAMSDSMVRRWVRCCGKTEISSLLGIEPEFLSPPGHSS
jgi:hypothetical protein